MIIFKLFAVLCAIAIPIYFIVMWIIDTKEELEELYDKEYSWLQATIEFLKLPLFIICAIVFFLLSIYGWVIIFDF